MLKMSSSTDSSSSATQIAVEYDGVNGVDDLLVKKLSKIRQKVKESSKISKSFKYLKILQRLSVWRNVYQSINVSSIKYKELKLPLEF